MKKRFYILWCVCWVVCSVHATDVVLVPDSTSINAPDSTFTLITLPPATPLPAGTPVRSRFMPDPDMAVWLAAVVPGLGQIYNRQYWKLPIVYGGAMGLAYAIMWNNQMYIDYHKAYVDLVANDPRATYYEHLLPAGVTITSENRDYYKRTFKNKQDSYQRYRDLSIVGVAVLYLLTLIDAYVDAQMADYDISPDLSIQIAPAVMAPAQYQQTDTSVGVRCKLKF